MAALADQGFFSQGCPHPAHAGTAKSTRGDGRSIRLRPGIFMQAVHSVFIHLALADNGKHEQAKATQHQSHGRDPLFISTRPGTQNRLVANGTLVYESVHYRKLMLDNNNVTELILCDGCIGTFSQPSLARVEVPLGSHRNSPSLEMLRKYAAAANCKLEIRLVPQKS